MFSSNNTSDELFKLALADGGCILNLDDISMIDKVPKFPELNLLPVQSRRETHGQPDNR